MNGTVIPDRIVSPMVGQISMGARREIKSAVAERYRQAGRAEKGWILDTDLVGKLVSVHSPILNCSGFNN